MADDTKSSGQAYKAPSYDDSPSKFMEDHPEDQFSGSSGLLFEQAMAQTRMAICLTDPALEDHPIVFANRAFRELTGYAEGEIIGRNCRFLQGPETDPAPVQRIREAISREEVVVVELLNYRKDGSTFWNALHLGPIYNSDNKLAYFFGSQWDTSDVVRARDEEENAKNLARELSHRMKNLFAVISGIVNVTGRMRGIESEAAEINARIQALGRAYETTLDDASKGTIDVGQAIAAILAPHGGEEGRLVLKGGELRAPFAIISTLGLVLHELAANATKYGAWSTDGSQVAVDWSTDADEGRLKIRWVESGGPPILAQPTNGSGTAIVDRLVRSSRGTIGREWNQAGLTALIDLPMRGNA